MQIIYIIVEVEGFKKGELNVVGLGLYLVLLKARDVDELVIIEVIIK